MHELWDEIEESVDDPILALALDIEVRLAADVDDTEREMMLGRLAMYDYDRERAALAVLSRSPGLELCPVCGDVRGMRRKAVSTCFCDGLDCGRCGLGRIRRPITDHFVPHTNSFWHTPYFGNLAACRFCQATVLRTTGEGLDNHLDIPEPAASVVGEVRDVCDALRVDGRTASGLILVGGELVVAHADVDEEFALEALVRWRARPDRLTFGQD